ncbi:hypothetical protein Leryth_021157 [Lithospermum erythrorhizon]|nr:hypothetical protein Leryth_021157 [Lithospermum erythrorhizon]
MLTNEVGAIHLILYPKTACALYVHIYYSTKKNTQKTCPIICRNIELDSKPKIRIQQKRSKENRRECYRQSNFQSGDMNSNSSTVIKNSRNIDMMNGEIPISDALISQIEVQKHLQDQFEVQKKLQRRIEAQGRYLQAILERAQRSLSIDMNCPDNLEATKTRINDFNLALSNIMDNINGEGNNNGSIIDKRITNDISIIHGSDCLLGQEEDEEEEDIKVT